MIEAGQEGNRLAPSGFFNPMLGAPSSNVFFGGGGGGGISAKKGVFEIAGEYVVNCYIIVGRTLVSCADTRLSILGEPEEGEPPVSDGAAIYAKISYGAVSWSLSVHGDGVVSNNAFNKRNTLTDTYRLLYVYDDGVWVDCRWMPVVVAMD